MLRQLPRCVDHKASKYRNHVLHLVAWLLHCTKSRNYVFSNTKVLASNDQSCSYGPAMLDGHDDASNNLDGAPSAPKTLLPSPLASFVSLATSGFSLSLRVGGFIGHSAINAARVGSLSGIELGRAILENILFRAGQDVVELSTGRLGKVAAEGILESAVRSTLNTYMIASTTSHVDTDSTASFLHCTIH